MAQQRPGAGDGVPDMRRRPERVDAGAEIDDVRGMTTYLSRGGIHISAMQPHLQTSHLSPIAKQTPSAEAAIIIFVAEAMSPGCTFRPSAQSTGRSCATPS